MRYVSDSLRSLTKNERIANFFKWIAHLLILLQKNEQFNQKTYDQIPNPWLGAVLRVVDDKNLS